MKPSKGTGILTTDTVAIVQLLNASSIKMAMYLQGYCESCVEWDMTRKKGRGDAPK